MKKKINIFVILLFSGVLVGVLPFPLFAKNKDKAPPSYQSGKLLDIQESKETKVASYNTTKNKDGSTVTTPVMDTVKRFDISVQLGDLTYVGRYEPTWSWGKPPNWIIGDPIEVRIDSNKMFLKKPDGKELKTKIVKRVRAGQS
jgi:hypothetical protein